MVLKSPKSALILTTGLNQVRPVASMPTAMRVGDVEPLVGHDADQHDRDRDVDDGADQRATRGSRSACRAAGSRASCAAVETASNPT